MAAPAPCCYAHRLLTSSVPSFLKAISGLSVFVYFQIWCTMTDHSILYYGLVLFVIYLTNPSFAEYSLTVNYKNSSTCDLPESWNVLFEKYIVQPDESCKSFKVLRCYCLTSDSSSSNSRTPTLFVGNCLYGCFRTEPTAEYYTTSLPFSNNGTCSVFNREGVLCGQCSRDHAPPAYSFSLTCIHCGNVSLWTTAPRYIAVAFGPLTIFLAVIVVFTISVNTAPLRGFILACQLLSGNVLMRTILLMEKFHSGIFPYIQIFGTVYGVWNLDFFRLVYPSFCLHPGMTTIQVIAMDYFIAAYPLVLILMMYAMVNSYDRQSSRVMVLLGRLLQCCCIRFRRHLNIRTSLVDAFGTFFSLSYIKFASTTFDLLVATKVWSSATNATSQHVFVEGTMESFKGNHLFYAIPALTITLVCNILPLVLLLLYSFPKGQGFLNFMPTYIQRILYPFMDNILSCYKDGTNGTRNCRYFAIVYHLAVVLYGASFILAKSPLLLGCNAFVLILVVMLLVAVRPYKSKVYNTVDTILILSVGLWTAGGLSSFIAYVDAPFNKAMSLAMLVIPFTFPFFYLLGYVGYKCFSKIHRKFDCDDGTSLRVHQMLINT